MNQAKLAKEASVLLACAENHTKNKTLNSIYLQPLNGEKDLDLVAGSRLNLQSEAIA
jgi:hypothetical protein